MQSVRHASCAKLRATITVNAGFASGRQMSALMRPSRLCAHRPAGNARGWKSSGQPLARTVAALLPLTTNATRLADRSNSAPPARFNASRCAVNAAFRSEPACGPRRAARSRVRHPRQIDVEQTPHLRKQSGARHVALYVPGSGETRFGERDIGRGHSIVARSAGADRACVEFEFRHAAAPRPDR